MRSSSPLGRLAFVALPLVLFEACNAILGIGEPRDPLPDDTRGGNAGTQGEHGGESGGGTSGTGGSRAGGSSGSGASGESTGGGSGVGTGGTNADGGIGGEDSGGGGLGGANAGSGAEAGESGAGTGGAPPVVVTATSVADKTIQENFIYPGDEAPCRAKSDSGSEASTTCLMRWDLSSIPTGSMVQDVALDLYIANASPQPISTYPLRASWSEQSATWTLRLTATPWEVPGAKGALDRSEAVGTFLFNQEGRFRVPAGPQWISLVQTWVDAPSTNFGISFTSVNNDDGIVIATKDDVTEFHPRLVVTYLAPLAR